MATTSHSTTVSANCTVAAAHGIRHFQTDNKFCEIADFYLEKNQANGYD